ncbi:MAG: sigma-70 family RNA polymerase sigma factor [Ignavibacteriales bacterium]|nr:MAG: sigma-70 family RNA polymerase sigma factor [Ignavibacteriales bacterium]
MKNLPAVYNPEIEQVLRTNNTATAVWINYAVKFIRVFFRNDKFKPTAHDVVTDMILKIHLGERRWEPDKININTFMYYNIRSHVYSLAKKEKRLVSTDEYNALSDSFDNKYIDVYHISKEEIETTQDKNEMLEIVHKSIKGDDLCELVFYCMREGFGVNETAEYLGVSIAEANNAVRRIKYKAQKALK